jgi:DNA-binding HxlR family transcriptional regulator
MINENIQDLCVNLNAVIKVIKKPRAQLIITILYKSEYSFKELKDKTGIPQGSLHNNLNKLYGVGLLCKTPNERPIQYRLTKFAYNLLDLI